jgi:DNA mismatch repair protein MutS
VEARSGGDGGGAGGGDGARDAAGAGGASSAEGAVQAVFDVGSGEFVESDGGETELDPETERVLSELRDVDVNETLPVELLSRVQEWQRRLDTED